MTRVDEIPTVDMVSFGDQTTADKNAERTAHNEAQCQVGFVGQLGGAVVVGVGLGQDSHKHGD